MLENTYIDLRSDTKTLPDQGMLDAMVSARVGDSQVDEDPTCLDLCEMVANLLGKEKAIFLPSGTMCNQIAMRVHCKAGDKIICDKFAHVHFTEAGGMAGISGATPHVIDGNNGKFSPQDLQDAIFSQASAHYPKAKLLSIEQTTNYGGGEIWDISQIKNITKIAKHNNLSTHMDGARLLNAVVASNTTAQEYAQFFDSVWIDFSKGLGAPVGAVLAGDKDFIVECRRYQQMLGGAMRQAGIIAAACIYALEHNISKLLDDHTAAKQIASAIDANKSLKLLTPSPATNIVLFESALPEISNADIVNKLKDKKVLSATLTGTGNIRAVTHLSLSKQSIAKASEIIASV